MSQRLDKLNLQHRAACRLKVEGKTIAHIAEELGVATRTLHVWFSDDLIKAELSRLHERIEDVWVQRRSEVGLRALDELMGFAEVNAVKTQAQCVMCNWYGESPEPHGDPNALCYGPYDRVPHISEGIKLDALREILDRIDQSAKLRDRAEAQKALNGGADGGGQVNYLAIFQNASDEDIAGLLRRWATVDASPNGHSPADPSLPGPS